MIIALLVLLLAGGGGAYWFVTRQSSPPVTIERGTIDEIDESGPVIAADDSEPDEDFSELDDADTPAEKSEVNTQPLVPAGETFSDPLKSGGTAPTMVWIPQGDYEMGARDSAAQFDERPQHKVSLRPFAISRTEVTIADYNKFARSAGRKIPKTGDLDPATYPVFFVSWDDAVAYTKWLSVQTGKNYRLPTEAEWEYAARAGSPTAYPWGRSLGREHAHCFACETGLDPRQPTKVARFDPNPFGTYDMSGNVDEWVYDCYNKNYEGAPSDGSVFEGGDCSVRVIRGGSFSSGPKALRSSARNKFRFDSGNDSIGIRIVRDP
jgi:formylglycine-generating enzyme required for sulfatase activity